MTRRQEGRSAVTPPRRAIEPIDPNSPGGRAAAEALSQVLAEITVAVRQRRAVREQYQSTAA